MWQPAIVDSLSPYFSCQLRMIQVVHIFVPAIYQICLFHPIPHTAHTSSYVIIRHHTSRSHGAKNNSFAEAFGFLERWVWISPGHLRLGPWNPQTFGPQFGPWNPIGKGWAHEWSCAVGRFNHGWICHALCRPQSCSNIGSTFWSNCESFIFGFNFSTKMWSWLYAIIAALHLPNFKSYARAYRKNTIHWSTCLSIEYLSLCVALTISG